MFGRKPSITDFKPEIIDRLLKDLSRRAWEEDSMIWTWSHCNHIEGNVGHCNVLGLTEPQSDPKNHNPTPLVSKFVSFDQLLWFWFSKHIVEVEQSWVRLSQNKKNINILRGALGLNSLGEL